MAGQYECVRCERTLRMGNSKSRSVNNLCARCCRELREQGLPVNDWK